MRNLTFSQIILLPKVIRCWLCALYFVKHFIYILSFNSPKPLWNRYYYNLCFVNEQTRKQRYLASCLRWHNQCLRGQVITSCTVSWCLLTPGFSTLSGYVFQVYRYPLSSWDCDATSRELGSRWAGVQERPTLMFMEMRAGGRWGIAKCLCRITFSLHTKS